MIKALTEVGAFLLPSFRSSQTIKNKDRKWNEPR